ncbi:MAG: glycosyltransferase family 4 protein [Candidatus Omnitrophica bacterium]|nr:glycosyltransferase family 4 protein [Candidatus Omnitrophota bacterium]
MKNRSVAIDARMWGHPGIGRYIRELSGALVHQSADLDFLFLGPEVVRQWLDGRRPHPHVFQKTHSPIYSIREQFEILKGGCSADLLHVPHFNIPVFFPGRLVVTLHDLIYLKDARSSFAGGLGRAYAQTLFAAVGRRASAILTVSEHTRKDLLDCFSWIDSRKIHVTPEAVSPQFQKIRDGQVLSQIKHFYGLDRPFVLYVGSFKRHKNLEVLLEAMRLLREENKCDHDLVLIGRPDKNNTGLLRQIARLSFVKTLGEVPDQDLPALYNLADLFVLPSLIEGFGLPVLEAMACGVPVIASNRTSLPEVGGQAALYFEPTQIDALRELLYNVLRDKELREKMIALGFDQARLFSWENTADLTLRVYEKALR